MSRILVQAALKVAEVAIGTEAKVGAQVGKLATEAAEGLTAGQATARVATDSVNRIASGQPVSKLASEAAEVLSGGEATTAKGTLSLPKSGKASGDGPEMLSVKTRNGRVNVEVERVRRFGDASSRGATPAAARGVEEMSELEANQYLTSLLKNQDRIVAHNLRIAERDPDSIGKFAQVGVFKPLQARFDALKTNPNVRLMSVADGSALDAAGADAIVANFKNKHMWLADVKPKPYLDPKTGELVERGMIPTARSNSLIEYDSTLFRKTPKGWTVNEASTDFRKFIDESAQRLVRLSENPSLFSVMKTPPPNFLPGSPAEAFTGVSRFQKSLLMSGDSHLSEYGRVLNGTLRYLQSPEAKFKFAKFGSF